MKISLLLFPALLAAAAPQFDVIVYGGTSGGVVAAVTAAREGLTVAILDPGRHLGGMSSGGLGRTDRGDETTIGGYALEFYKRIGKHYAEPITWDFEPHVAEDTFQQMVKEAGVKVFYDHRIRLDGGVSKRKGQIREIFIENGTSFEAKVFIDASYEGDLLAQAKASYTVGRESSGQYGESLAGVRPKDRNHQFNFAVQATGDVPSESRGEIGSGDKKVQAYNFRLCLSSDAKNRVPFPKPKIYDPGRYELLIRYIEAFKVNKGKEPTIYGDLFGWSKMPNDKTDINNKGPVSTDYIGASWGYPLGDYKQRTAMWQDHIDYTAGLFYFLAHDERVPESIRKELAKWGLAADEFADTNNWPHQLYIREARRMVGDFVMTQKDIQTDITKPDAIGMGSYKSDSHNVQRYIQADGTVQNEGNMEVPVTPYQIPYRVLLPKSKQVTNLLVPVCVSASHVSYSTLRMEPVYMIMGQAAGVAAKMAIAGGVSVQNVDTKALREILLKQGAVMAKP